MISVEKHHFLAVLLVLFCMKPVEKVTVSAVSYPGAYDNAAGPEEAAAACEAPPDYSGGEGLSAFSDAAIRRGEGARSRRREGQAAREAQYPFFFAWSEPREG